MISLTSWVHEHYGFLFENDKVGAKKRLSRMCLLVVKQFDKLTVTSR